MIIDEGSLRFEFGENWLILKLDDESAYRNWLEKLDGTKAVDIVGIYEQDKLHFLEAKDFRGYAIENKKRLISGDILVEVAQKVRDSVSCLITASRLPSQHDLVLPYKTLLCDEHTKIFVTLWVEFDQSLQAKAKAAIQNKLLKEAFRWLGSNCKVQIANIDNNLLPDLIVTNLPVQN